MSIRVVAVGLGLLWAGSGFAQAIDVDGAACPGPLTIEITGMTASANTSLLTGKPGGSTVLATGPCAGTTINMRMARVISNGRADASGARTVSVTGTASTCSNLVQAVDLSTCAKTPAVSMMPTCDTIDV